MPPTATLNAPDWVFVVFLLFIIPAIYVSLRAALVLRVLETKAAYPTVHRILRRMIYSLTTFVALFGILSVIQLVARAGTLLALAVIALGGFMPILLCLPLLIFGLWLIRAYERETG